MKKKMLPQEKHEEDEEDHHPDDAQGWVPNFHWLTDALAVGGSFPSERAGELARVHGIGAVVDLRREQRDDEAQLRAHGIDFLHLPTPDLEPASAAMLDKGVRFAGDQFARGRKLLIHCQHGIGRSALLALCVLVDQGWEPLEALKHAKDRREHISPSESQFRGWAEWLRSRGKTPPDYHSFGCIAYRHLAKR
jgi:protein-tyrosine phosphatase